MLKRIGQRLLEAIPTLLVVAAITFLMVRLAPGGPFDREKELPKEVKAALEARYGLDLPVAQQFTNYLGGILRGDFGESMSYPGWDVTEIIASKLPVSIELGLYALFIACGWGMLTGTWAATRPNTLRDYGTMALAMLGICLPTFVVGPVLVLTLSLKLEWFNASGWFTPTDRVLPALTLGLYYAAYISRLTRGSMLEVLNQDFIRTARAKGVAEWQVIALHALRNALLPVVSYLGPAAAGLVTGSFVVETIFRVPGLGRFFVNSAFNRDYTMVMGTVLVYATLIITFNLLTEIVQGWLDPRQRKADA